MSVTLGASASKGSTDGNTAATPARLVTAGSCLIVTVGWGSGTSSDATVTDNASNTYVKVGSSQGPTTGGAGGYETRSVTYKCESCTGNAALVITATRSGEYPSVAFQEFKGSGVVVEAVSQNLDSATPFTSNNAGPPAANGSGVYGGLVHNASTTNASGINSPMTVVEELSDITLYYPLAVGAGVQTTAAALAADFTHSGTTCGLVTVVLLKESASGITGTVTQTLAAATLSATGKLDVKGSLAVSLDPATSTSTGKLDIKGSDTTTLAGATLSASGALAVKGSLAVTLGDATLAASGVGSVPIIGTLAVTLAPATLSANGAATLRGSVSLTLAPATSSSTGTLQIVGTASQTLGNATLAATGKLDVKGVVSATLADATLSASGVSQALGSGSVNKQLADALLVAVGSSTLHGSVDAILAPATSNGVSTLTIRGALAGQLDPATLNAYGHDATVPLVFMDVELIVDVDVSKLVMNAEPAVVVVDSEPNTIVITLGNVQ